MRGPGLLYKFLEGRDPMFMHGVRNPRHGRWHLGRWKEVDGGIDTVMDGITLLREENLARSIGPDLYLAEVDETRGWLDVGYKVICRRARIVEHLRGWNERTACLAAADFAEMVLQYFERKRPLDQRVWTAIHAARQYAHGRIDDAARREAADGANRAANDVKGDLAKAAAIAAAWSASRPAWLAADCAARWAAGADGDAIRARQGTIILDYAHGRRG